MATKFQFRRGSSAQWASVNPVLLAGEIGLDLDLHQFKFGDGVTPWNALSFGGFIDAIGASGFSGYSGFSGNSTSGYSGFSGISGYSGNSTSGYSGYSGTAGIAGDRYSGTSTNVLTIGLGTRSFTIEPDLAWTPAQPVIISYNDTNLMDGVVVSYDKNTGNMVVNVVEIKGSGSYSQWSVNLSGAVGVNGVDGASGYSGYSGASADPNLKKRVSNILTPSLLTGGILSINASDPTKFDITGGTGFFVDNTFPDTPTYVPVVWNTQTGLTVTNLATEQTTFIYITPDGSILQSATDPNAIMRRSYIFIGYLDHPGQVEVEACATQPESEEYIRAQISDFWFALGNFNIDGNVFSAQGANLYLKRSGGRFFESGTNWANDNHNPNVYTSVDHEFCQLNYFHRMSDTEWMSMPRTDIDPNHYDPSPNGTPAVVPAGKWTVQPILYYPPSDSTEIQYGQQYFDSSELAKQSIINGFVLNPFSAGYSAFRGYLVVKQGATDLSNTEQAIFITATKLQSFAGMGGVGGGIGGGEVNTITNVGLSGVGFFDAKQGIDFQFRNLRSKNASLTVEFNADLKTVDLDILGGVGASGYSGYSGQDGVIGGPGASGYSGYSGSAGSAGTSGYSGYSGSAGGIGTSGYSGYSGAGTSGYSGYSGSVGTSGYSGYSGSAGTSGYSGYSGSVGTSGYSGYSGKSGYSGYSGSGVSGYSGYSGAGTSGYSGYSGSVGTSGYSGYSGSAGSVGTSGYSGYSGSGVSGYSGYSGALGPVNTQFQVDINRFGFLNQTETTISFDPSTYTFTLADAGSGWSYYRFGVKYTISGNKTVVLPGTPPAKAMYFIYIDANNGTLSVSTTPWSLAVGSGQVPVATVTWDNSMTPKYWLMEERHSCLIDRKDHHYLHTTRGTQWVSGGDVSGQSVTIDTNVAKACAISQCVIADEDILNTLTALSDPDGASSVYPVFYRNGSGSTTYVWATGDMPFKYAASGYVMWDNPANNGGTLVEGSSGHWYNTYLIYTNMNGDARFIIVHGREEFTSLNAALAEDARYLDWTGLPVLEWAWGYKFTWEANSSYTSKGKCVLASVPYRLTGNILGAAGQQGPQGLSGTSGYSGFSGAAGGMRVDPFTSQTSVTVTHNYGSKPVVVVLNSSNVVITPSSITHNSNNDFTVTFGGSTTGNILSFVGGQGVSGMSGYSGYSGITGTSGYSGYSGSGVSGYSGYSGYSGKSGYSGYSGSGVSGYSGYSGSTGTSGYSGYSGASTSGYSGYSGSNGATGTSGYSGYSGTNGATGTSGYSGYSGTNGSPGTSGYSGYSGASTSGYSGYSGSNGSTGTSGYSGYSGTSGYSGYSGASTSGYSGYSGSNGATGTSGYSGYSGIGTSGYSGYSGSNGSTGTSGYSGYSGAGTSGYSGYSGANGSTGTSGYSGYSGSNGATGTSGYSGYSGVGTSGYSGYSGTNGSTGTSGYSGYSGNSTSGYSGYSGSNGSPGTSGYSGYSGVGTSGYSGYSGAGTSGYSGYSGAGTSGYSGYSGDSTSGYSGYSGVDGGTGVSGYSGYSGAGGGNFTALSTFNNMLAETASVASFGGQNSCWMGVFNLPYPLSCQTIGIPMAISGNTSSTNANSSGSTFITMSIGLYSLNATNSTRFDTMWTRTSALTLAGSAANISYTYSLSSGTASSNSSNSAILTRDLYGIRLNTFDVGSVLPAGIYAIGHIISSTTSNNALNYLSQASNNLLLFRDIHTAISASVFADMFDTPASTSNYVLGGQYKTTTGAMPASFGVSEIKSVSHLQPMYKLGAI